MVLSEPIKLSVVEHVTGTKAFLFPIKTTHLSIKEGLCEAPPDEFFGLN